MNFNEFLKIGKIREFLRILKRYASDSYSAISCELVLTVSQNNYAYV